VMCTAWGGNPVGKPLGRWRSPAVPLVAAHIHVAAEITPLEGAAMAATAFARSQDCCGRSSVMVMRRGSWARRLPKRFGKKPPGRVLAMQGEAGRGLVSACGASQSRNLCRKAGRNTIAADGVTAYLEF